MILVKMNTLFAKIGDRVLCLWLSKAFEPVWSTTSVLALGLETIMVIGKFSRLTL